MIDTFVDKFNNKITPGSLLTYVGDMFWKGFSLKDLKLNYVASVGGNSNFIYVGNIVCPSDINNFQITYGKCSCEQCNENRIHVNPEFKSKYCIIVYNKQTYITSIYTLELSYVDDCVPTLNVSIPFSLKKQ